MTVLCIILCFSVTVNTTIRLPVPTDLIRRNVQNAALNALNHMHHQLTANHCPHTKNQTKLSKIFRSVSRYLLTIIARKNTARHWKKQIMQCGHQLSKCTKRKITETVKNTGNHSKERLIRQIGRASCRERVWFSVVAVS